MEISQNNSGAATFALKQALKMPNVLLGLIKTPVANGGEPLSQADAPPQSMDLAQVTGKGRIIDITV